MKKLSSRSIVFGAIFLSMAPGASGCSTDLSEPQSSPSESIATLMQESQKLSKEEFWNPKPMAIQGNYFSSTNGVAMSLDEGNLRAPDAPGIGYEKFDLPGDISTTEEIEDAPGKKYLLSWMDGKEETAEIEVIVRFEDIPFAWRELGALKGSSRSQALEFRREQMKLHTASLRKKVEALGGKDIEVFLATPVLGLTLSLGALRVLMEESEILDITPRRGSGEFGPELAYTGHEARAGMKIKNFEDYNYNASSGSQAGGAVRVGVIDRLSLLANHPGFSRRKCITLGTPPFTFPFCDFSGSAFAATWNCTSTSASCSSWIPVYSGADHGTKMAGLLNGSIEEGQDPNFVNTTERRRRSGIIPQGKASLYFYGISSTNVPGQGDAFKANDGLSFAKAADRVIADDLDVVVVALNFSGRPDSDIPWDWCVAPCSRTGDCNGMNSSLRNIAQQGTLIVKSAGNSGTGGINTSSQQCRLTYPAWRPDTLTVGGLNTTPSSANYETAGMFNNGNDDGSALGGMDIKTQGSVRSKKLSGVDLVAPAKWLNGYTRDPSSGNPSYDGIAIQGEGTSGSTAATAGAAALLQHAAQTNGWTGYELLTNMLLMGDGYSAYDNTHPNFLGLRSHCMQPGSSSLSRPCGFDSWSGAGRVHMHYPSSEDLDGPYLGANWGWGSVSGSVSHMQYSPGWFVAALSPPPGVTQVKIAMMFEEDNLDNSADLDLEVYNACSGTGYGLLINRDASYDNRSRLVMKPSDYTTPLQCWGVRVRGFHVPFSTAYGTSRTFHLAWYWHTQNPALH